MKARTRSQHARDLKAEFPDMLPTEIAVRVRMSRQGVESALAADPTDLGGRPPIGVECPRCHGSGRVPARRSKSTKGANR